MTLTAESETLVKLVADWLSRPKGVGGIADSIRLIALDECLAAIEAAARATIDVERLARALHAVRFAMPDEPVVVCWFCRGGAQAIADAYEQDR